MIFIIFLGWLLILLLLITFPILATISILLKWCTDVIAVFLFFSLLEILFFAYILARVSAELNK